MLPKSKPSGLPTMPSCTRSARLLTAASPLAGSRTTRSVDSMSASSIERHSATGSASTISGSGSKPARSPSRPAFSTIPLIIVDT